MLKTAHQKNPPTFPFLNRGISTCPGMRDAKSIAETLLANTERASMGKSITYGTVSDDSPSLQKKLTNMSVLKIPMLAC